GCDRGGVCEKKWTDISPRRRRRGTSRGPAMSANYEVRGGDVAVITLDNPPVNGLGYDTRRGIVDGLDRALADDKVKAIVVTGAGKAFSGGADIREFGSPKAIAEPGLP